MSAGVKELKTLAWLGPLYFTEGLPNAIVGSLSVGYYKSMGMDNATVAALTSSLYLPWVLKGIWGPVVDSYSTKRSWIFFCCGVFFACLAALSLAQFAASWVIVTAALFWVFGFASATFDIAADGFYMLALPPRSQSFFIGFRNAFYRIAVLFGQGAMMVLAGFAERMFGSIERGWAVSFGICAATVGLCIPAIKFFMPAAECDTPANNANGRGTLSNIADAFREFFTKKDILCILAFVLLYRFAEAQLVRVVQPFMLDAVSDGGLGMTKEQMGLIYGTIAPVALLLGGFLGGVIISKYGLARCIMPYAAAINIPNVIYVYMAAAQPQNAVLNALLISAEQFGYGLGFSSYMVFLMWASRGKNRASSYALCTSLMALGMMFPGAFSGAIQVEMGYENFFYWILLSTVVSFAVAHSAARLIKKSDAY